MKKSKIAILISTILVVVIFSAVIAEAVITKGDIPILNLLFPDNLVTQEEPTPEPTQTPEPTDPPLTIIKAPPPPSPTPLPSPTPEPPDPGKETSDSSSSQSTSSGKGENASYADSVSSRPIVTEPTPQPAPDPEPPPEPDPPPPPDVTSITLDNTSVGLSVGDVWQINILSAPEEVWDYGITCSISNSNIIDTVSYGGSSVTIQANNTGTATVIIYGGNYSASCTITVS